MPNAWAEFIKLHRLQHGMTQAQLAAVLGVSQRTVSRWERGEDNPSLPIQRKLRDLLYRPVTYLVQSLIASVAHCPAPRALSRMPNLQLVAVSPAAIAKRPSIVGWLGRDLSGIATGLLRDMLDDHDLQRAITRREVATVVTTTRSVLHTPESAGVGTYQTTISYLSIDGTIYSDAIAFPAAANAPLGWRAIRFDEMV